MAQVINLKWNLQLVKNMGATKKDLAVLWKEPTHDAPQILESFKYQNNVCNPKP
jgi:hypothetical protein